VTWTGALFHLGNFAAPSAWVALVLVLGLRFLGAGRTRSAWQQFAVLWAAGLAVSLLGLWWFGRDGKMVTYAAMVTVMGSVGWALQRGRTGRSGR
jgi:hypothetical protein